MSKIIEFVNIDKAFSTNKILDNLNLSINKGDLIGLIGKSGEGKTTLLRVLIGFFKIDAGQILFNDQDITKKTSLIRDVVGFCTQENSFYPELTIEENLWYYGRLYKMSRRLLKKRSSHLLDLTGLEAHKKRLAGRISGGMKRRLDFAISLIHDPEILILDEPTTGLDPIIRKSIWDLIEKINKEGKTIIVSSHLLDFIEEKCKKIAFLSKGKVHVTTMQGLKKKYPKEKSLNYMFVKMIKQGVV
ncbi:ABC transporter ATP-binding protein [Candidatus Woesearchaeota archaeon]|jgi:ABC-2 type transport system ATP-binding protein|nr:ABC transporter ATP-binding protein [Candidatus Woesearchaeota archaeon]MBT5272776.1 ABC transporter ATP-binding protein [Candidatus Woesearchaeota archaeon]MBT6040388.1 ABC transporter ATP-binding protein [Candidatus Woesearchaeota archaeon]MBT6336979.1 ABC transporter ATP-binding protein [Candidatus Woesearchaeota archaeon]MBT7926865.1 ABC transporter ATP-binding protein [Candidatus Woesearchaeota archaeon]